MREVFALAEVCSEDRYVQLEEPPTLSSMMEKPKNAEAVRAHTGRFRAK